METSLLLLTASSIHGGISETSVNKTFSLEPVYGRSSGRTRGERGGINFDWHALVVLLGHARVFGLRCPCLGSSSGPHHRCSRGLRTRVCYQVSHGW